MARNTGKQDRCPRCNIRSPRHANCASCGSPICWNQDGCKCGQALTFGGAILAKIILIALSQLLG